MKTPLLLSGLALAAAAGVAYATLAGASPAEAPAAGVPADGADTPADAAPADAPDDQQAAVPLPEADNVVQLPGSMTDAPAGIPDGSSHYDGPRQDVDGHGQLRLEFADGQVFAWKSTGGEVKCQRGQQRDGLTVKQFTMHTNGAVPKDARFDPDTPVLIAGVDVHDVQPGSVRLRVAAQTTSSEESRQDYMYVRGADTELADLGGADGQVSVWRDGTAATFDVDVERMYADGPDGRLTGWFSCPYPSP